jgi:hypothetical protein
MTKKYTAKEYWYDQDEGYEARCQRRLLKDLGVNDAAAETILHLRSQVIELQAQIHRLEAELAARETSQQMRLARYQEMYYEATWIELEFQE